MFERTILNGCFSEWSRVYSRVPQGSVLGPLAFVIFINDLDYEAGLITIINKFADDKKLGQRISSEEDKDNLQECLTRAENFRMKYPDILTNN